MKNFLVPVEQSESGLVARYVTSVVNIYSIYYIDRWTITFYDFLLDLFIEID